VTRLSLRLRLTLAFALVMAVVLAATGLVVYRIFRGDLDGTIDRSLGSRSDEVTALVRQAGPRLEESLRRVSGGEEDFAQVLSPDGAPLAATPQVRGERLLTGEPLSRASRRSVVVEHPPIGRLDGSLRLRAVPVDTARGGAIVVVGTSLGERDDSLRTLAALLAGGGAVALLLAALAGYGVATGALRPVEAMRRRAAAISPDEVEQRLPVPSSRDEVARLGATLNEMLARLEAAFVRERRFTADASHELRSPLGILKVELELALRRGRSSDELRAALESAAEETDRLVKLAEDLLVIARLDQGELSIRREEIDVSELLSAVAARFEARASAAGCPLLLQADDGIRLQGDAVRLEQALGNMVDNALRHATTEVRLGAVMNAAWVELHVIDDGPGFPPGFIEHAFERFARADGRSRGGTGLGLAIVAAIAASHGGSAHASNRPGRGADVWVELKGSRAHPPPSHTRSAGPEGDELGEIAMRGLPAH
jgi:heavy metal sensor kinase